MKRGDKIVVERDSYGHRLTDILDYIEVRELEPLSFHEAQALITMYGGTHGMCPLSPGVGLLPAVYQRTPLQELFASLPPTQRAEFMLRMNHLWPRPQQYQRTPRSVDGTGVKWWCPEHQDHHFIRTWDDTWAAALSAASQMRETAMSAAMIEAREKARVDT